MSTINTIDIIKQTAGAIAGFGIELICSTFARDMADKSGCNKLSKTLMKLGGVVIGGMIAAEADKYISSTIDDVADTVNMIGTISKECINERDGEE